ncbi:MAG: zinc-binding dehydrogenase [Chromatiales bacterium]|nr:zinc-binding dehydrogenase [Chromatiales bacterium]
MDEATPLRFAADGAPVVHGLRTAAFAEQAVVDGSQVVAIAKTVPFDSASLLACGVITGFGAVTNTARVRAGASTVVVGCGGVGLNAVQGASLSGAREVIAVDIADDKLAAATNLGATHVVNGKTEDAVARVRELTGSRGADYVFVTVGAQSAFADAYKMLARGGAAVLVGMAAVGVTSEFDPLTLAGDSQRILGSKMGSSNIHQDIPNLVTLYEQGRLKLDELITARYSLEDINEAIASVERGEAVRNVVVFN